MAYSKAQITKAATKLVSTLAARGYYMHMEVAVGWVTAEQGDNNNVLGLTDVNHKLYKFTTMDAGIDACVTHLLTSSYYANVRRTLVKSASIRTQALALIASPWNVPNSPYYRKVFTRLGLLKVVPKPVPAPTPTPTPAPTPEVNPVTIPVGTFTFPNGPRVVFNPEDAAPPYTGPFPVFSGDPEVNPNNLPTTVLNALDAGATGAWFNVDDVTKWYTYQYARAYAAKRGLIVNDPLQVHRKTAEQYLVDTIYGNHGDVYAFSPTATGEQKDWQQKARGKALGILGLITQP